MPADLFSFKNDDAIVTKYLSATERAAVRMWQASDLYKFEFHTGHDTGNPIYIRPAGNEDGQNLPKFDTKNKSAADYHGTEKGKPTGRVSVNALANGSKLAKQLKSVAQREIEALIGANWASLALLADRFWSDTAAPLVAVAATDKACKTNGCAGRVPIVASGKSSCDTCFAFQ